MLETPWMNVGIAILLLLLVSPWAAATPQEDRVRKFYAESIAGNGDGLEFVKNHPNYLKADLIAAVVEACEAIRHKKPYFLGVDPLTLNQSGLVGAKTVRQTDSTHVAVEFIENGPRGQGTRKCIFLFAPDLKVSDILFPDSAQTLRTMADKVNRMNKAAKKT